MWVFGPAGVKGGTQGGLCTIHVLDPLYFIGPFDRSQKAGGWGWREGWGPGEEHFCLPEELIPLLDTPSDPSYLGVGELG